MGGSLPNSPRPGDAILGRARLLREIGALLQQRRSVLLVGPRHVGKTALIAALDRPDLLTVDPFERITSHHAWRIRRAMDHGVVCIAAARTLDRSQLGHVRRIAFRFTTVRVPPLSTRLIQALIERDVAAASLSGRLIAPDWIRDAAAIARGRPGVALAIVRETAREAARSGRLPIPAVAFVQACVDDMTPATADQSHISFRSAPTRDMTTPARTIAAIQRHVLP